VPRQNGNITPFKVSEEEYEKNKIKAIK